MSGGEDEYEWSAPETYGPGPSPRESHTCVAYKPTRGTESLAAHATYLIIYGGMSGVRLGDLWLLNVATMQWSMPMLNGSGLGGGTLPSPRSLHSATLVRDRMVVFGGWVPLVYDTNGESAKSSALATNTTGGGMTMEKEWKCSNTLVSLDLLSMRWESMSMSLLSASAASSGSVEEGSVPRARAGHSAVCIANRVYVWSGRDGYRKAWNNQVCCKDLWYLESEVPAQAHKPQLVQPGIDSLELTWAALPNAEAYILQIQAVDLSLGAKSLASPSSSSSSLSSTSTASLSPAVKSLATPAPTVAAMAAAMAACKRHQQTGKKRLILLHYTYLSRLILLCACSRRNERTATAAISNASSSASSHHSTSTKRDSRKHHNTNTNVYCQHSSHAARCSNLADINAASGR